MATFSKEDINYMRLQRLVSQTGTISIREYFDNCPIFRPVLQAFLTRKSFYLQTLKTKNIINSSQWDILFPSGGAVPTSNQFDLTLLVLLLRNYGALGAPRNFKWGELPLPVELYIYHDIARLKYYRNKYAHATSGVSDADFLKDWKEIEEAILRIVPAAKKAQFTSEIDKLKTTPLNQEDLVKLLNQIQNESSRYSDEIKDKIRKLQSLTLKNTKTIITETKRSKVRLANKIENCARQNHDEMNEQTVIFQTHLNMTSEKQKEHTQNVTDQQTATYRTHLNETSEKQKEHTQNVTDQQTAVLIKKFEENYHGNEKSRGDRKKTTERGRKINTDGILQAFSKKLRKVYKERFSKVQSVSSDGVPTMFDVTSKLYMDLDCTPLEMRCMRVDNRTCKKEEKSLKRTNENQNKETTCKRFKGQHDESFNRLNHHEDSLEPVSKSVNHFAIVKDGYGEDPMIFQEQKKSKTENEKPTTTAHISRLVTTDSNPGMLPILIEAEAGVGKTTLFHRLALNWANDSKNMEQFKLVFLIPLRRVKSKKIEDIICKDLQLLLPEHKKDLKRCLDLWEDQILFLVDGLDEVKLSADNELQTLLQETGRHVFCSSRPLQEGKGKENYHGMENYILVKLLGFSDETLVKYINLYFQEKRGDEDINADKVIAECSKHFYCRALIKIPLYAGLLCFLWDKYKDEFPETATQLFNRFLLEVLTNYFFRHSHPKDKCSNTLHMLASVEKISFLKSPIEKTVPPMIRRMLRNVSKLAYATLMEHKVIFTMEDADQSELSLEDLTHMGLFSIEDDGALIYFRHKLFHEYFAGLYLTLRGDQVYKLFNDSREEIIGRSHILQNAFFFAAGLCEETYERILFALNYSVHGSFPSKSLLERTLNSCFTIHQASTIDPNSNIHEHLRSCNICITCTGSQKHDYYRIAGSKCPASNHLESCKRCEDMLGSHKHDYDIEKVSECLMCNKMANAIANPGSMGGRDSSLADTNEGDLQVLSFFVQLAFEHHKNVQNSGTVSRLPVHCSSAHSLAATMYVLGMKQRDKSTSIVLIGGPVIDIDQLFCILNECSNNEHIKCITLLKASEALIREVLNMEWKYVNKIGFEECDSVVPFGNVIESFPNIEVVFIDESTWQSKGKFTSGKSGGVTPHDVKVFVTDCRQRDKEKERELHVDSIDPCKLSFLYNHSRNRVISVLVGNYANWPHGYREKCLPDSVMTGICYWCFENVDDVEHSRLTGKVHPYGLQWEHTEYSRGSNDEQSQPDVSLRFEGNYSVLSVNVNQTKYYDEIMEVTIALSLPFFGYYAFCVHKTVNLFIRDLLQKEWTDVSQILFTECNIIVPVDILAKTFPDLRVVRYDKETLGNVRTSTQIPNSMTTPETNEDICVCFTEVDDVTKRTLFSNCDVYCDKGYRYIEVVLESDWVSAHNSAQPSEWKYLFLSWKNIKILCTQKGSIFNPAIKHLECVHINETHVIADVCKHNPDLKEVVLDLPQGIQEHEPVVDEVLSVLESSGQQWNVSSFSFHCECKYEITQRGVTLSYGATPKPLEVPYDKVQAWSCKNYDVLKDHERFVLHHHMLHKATREEREKYKSHTLSKDMIVSWMKDVSPTALDKMESGLIYNVEVDDIGNQTLSAKFTKDELWEGFSQNLPRWAQLLYH